MRSSYCIKYEAANSLQLSSIPTAQAGDGPKKQEKQRKRENTCGCSLTRNCMLPLPLPTRAIWIALTHPYLSLPAIDNLNFVTLAPYYFLRQSQTENIHCRSYCIWPFYTATTSLLHRLQKGHKNLNILLLCCDQRPKDALSLITMIMQSPT